MNSEIRQLFAVLHRFAATEERRTIAHLWSMAKTARSAPDRELEQQSKALMRMTAPLQEHSRAAYVAALCVYSHESKVRQVLKACTA